MYQEQQQSNLPHKHFTLAKGIFLLLLSIPAGWKQIKKKREEIITLKTHECTIIIEAAFTVKSRFLLYSLTKSKKK